MLLQFGPLPTAPKPTTGLPTLRAWARLSLPRNPEERIRAHPFGGPAACRHLPVMPGLVVRRSGFFYRVFLFGRARLLQEVDEEETRSPALKGGVPAAKKGWQDRGVPIGFSIWHVP